MSAARKPGLFLAQGVVALAAVLMPAIQSAAQSLTSNPLPSKQVLSRYGLERAWWSQATINPARSRVQYITLDEENLYVQTTGGVLTVFDSESGKKLWARQMGQRDEPGFAAASNRDGVFVVAGLFLYSIDKFRGDVIWKLRLPKQPSTSPTVDERQVYFGTLDGSVFAYSLAEIRKLYTKNLLPAFSQSALRWRYKAGKEVSSPAISTGRIVNFASRDGSLYSVTTELRKLAWQFETDAPLSAPLTQARDSIVMASQDYNVYCIDIDNGALRWKPFVLGYPVRKKPRIIDDDIFLLADGGGMFCLSLTNGAKRWWAADAMQFLAATQDSVYVSDVLGNIVVLERQSGAFKGALPLRRFAVRLANDRTDRLYVSTEAGLIICLRELGKEFPVYHMFPDRLPIVPEIAPEQAPQSTEPAGPNPFVPESEPAQTP